MLPFLRKLSDTKNSFVLTGDVDEGFLVHGDPSHVSVKADSSVRLGIQLNFLRRSRVFHAVS